MTGLVPKSSDVSLDKKNQLGDPAKDPFERKLNDIKNEIKRDLKKEMRNLYWRNRQKNTASFTQKLGIVGCLTGVVLGTFYHLPNLDALIISVIPMYLIALVFYSMKKK